MSRDFGWEYPPGAASDPRAPYNAPECCGDCDVDCDCEECDCAPIEDDPDRKRDEQRDRLEDSDG